MHSTLEERRSTESTTPSLPSMLSTPSGPSAERGGGTVFPMPATRLASYGTLAVFLIAYTLVVVGAWVVFVAGGLNPVERATGGLVTLVLLVWPQLAPLGRREPLGVVRPHATAGRGGADYQRKGTA